MRCFLGFLLKVHLWGCITIGDFIDKNQILQLTQSLLFPKVILYNLKDNSHER